MKYFEMICSLLSNPNINKNQSDLELISLLKDAELFTFHSSNSSEPERLDESEIIHDPEGYKGDLDSPFQTIWIEMAEKDGVQYKVTVSENTDPDLPVVNTLGMLVHEVKPRTFRIWSLLEMHDKKFDIKIVKAFETSMMGEVAKLLIERLNKEAWGLESSRKHVHIGNGNIKQSRRIKRIIHVTPKKQSLKLKSYKSRSIEWTHSWTVRGHWRTIDGVGKNREGSGDVLGHTWVKAHIKGTGDLIKKTRNVHTDN